MSVGVEVTQTVQVGPSRGGASEISISSPFSVLAGSLGVVVFGSTTICSSIRSFDRSEWLRCAESLVSINELARVERSQSGFLIFRGESIRLGLCMRSRSGPAVDGFFSLPLVGDLSVGLVFALDESLVCLKGCIKFGNDRAINPLMSGSDAVISPRASSIAIKRDTSLPNPMPELVRATYDSHCKIGDNIHCSPSALVL